MLENVNFRNQNSYFLNFKSNKNNKLKHYPNDDYSFYGTVKENSSKNVFLKQYIEKKAEKEGVKIPEGLEIKVSSPDEYSKEFKDLLGVVSKNIYKARVVDLFNLLEKDEDSVEKRVSKMQISGTQKKQILQLKGLYDNYYKITADYKGKKINLLNPSNKDKENLNNISPEFADFIIDEQNDIQEVTKEFSRKEMQGLRLNEAGHNSKLMACALLPILLGIIGMGVFRSKNTAKQIEADLPKFLKEQEEIFKEGAPKLRNPITAFKENALKEGGILALLGTTLVGSWDDLMGCVKDFQQDKDNFGAKTALGINIPSALLGVASSAAIAPMIEDQISYNTASKYLKKYGKINASSNGIKNFMDKGGKTGIIAATGLFIANAVKGMITTSSSSGSSWGSMIGTRFVLGRNGDKLEEKNIITKDENSIENTNKNMMAYEAYKGKWKGIAISDPVLGILGGGLGLFTHSNPYLQSLAFGVQGCSETITACAYQISGKKVRNDNLEVDKQQLLKDV